MVAGAAGVSRVGCEFSVSVPGLQQRPNCILASAAPVERRRLANNAMNLTNRGVPGMKERRPSGEPGLAEVGPPVILSLGIAGYLSVSRHSAALSIFTPVAP